MEFRVTLIETEEGVAASCPSLRGCHSQGETREEALANIRAAIQEWLEAEQLEETEFKISEEIVRV
ncbi:MAG TPA: type II toxin-antitoxin system HicB family antitoxin [Candidatus Hydrogenedentes bacterium]|nr:type II toxin-antitoxin system HicB family antitoxin [Candidatus Hydrogenedentota bacterium]HRT20023.1 type II toxin-antitoxin system HicB family antitoxin [Candidatus Hydrogenedentota bacterium]HRT64701.1 type II toxin-antitoxin system HicB family antitoxin [Candidatus Hydrogenedentota bacterium]